MIFLKKLTFPYFFGPVLLIYLSYFKNSAKRKKKICKEVSKKFL